MRRKIRFLSFFLIISLALLNIALSNEITSQLLIEEFSSQQSNAIDSVVLENGYVRVLHNTSAYGSANEEIYGTRVIVALTKMTIKSSKGALALERGQIAAFHSNESYDSLTGDFFEVALKTKHPALKAPEEWIEPTKNTIVYEDEQLRVFEERLAGGDERPLHSHAQRIVVRLNDVQLTDPRFHETPRPGSGIQVPNTVKFAEPVVHVVRNVSKGPLFNIVIEFKIPHKNDTTQPKKDSN